MIIDLVIVGIVVVLLTIGAVKLNKSFKKKMDKFEADKKIKPKK